MAATTASKAARASTNSLGGAGDDIITDINGDDNYQGRHRQRRRQLRRRLRPHLLGDGNDFSVGGEDANETFGGEGNDYIIAGDDADTVFGDEGDDWIEGGKGHDLLQGDFGAPFQDSAHVGNDVIIGGAGDDDYDSESGDDIMLADDGIERNEGMLGFDWVTYRNDARAAERRHGLHRAPAAGSSTPSATASTWSKVCRAGTSTTRCAATMLTTAFLSAIDVTSGQNNALNSARSISL